MKSNPTQFFPNVNRPRAVASGTIFGGVDCYVFEDGSTALSQRGMLRGLRGKTTAEGGAEDGDLGRYLARLPEKYSVLAAAPFSFICPDGNVALGRPARDFVAMCRAYAEMFQEGTIHKARIPLARNAIAILCLLADRGIDEFIYDASNWHPRAMVQAPVESPVVLAQIESLAAMVTRLSADLGDVQQRLAAGTGYVAGTISPMMGAGIRRRLDLMGKRLGPCKIKHPKTGKVMSANSWRQTQDQALRRTLGHTGKWNTLPAALGAKAAETLDALDRAVDTLVAAVSQDKQLVLAVDNTKRAA